MFLLPMIISSYQRSNEEYYIKQGGYLMLMTLLNYSLNIIT